MNRAFLSTLALASLLTTGCDVAKKNVPTPPPPAPPTAIRGAEATSAEQASIADLPWWEVFKDEQLQALVKQTLANNYDLRVAQEKIVEARLQLGVTRTAQYPEVDLSASASTGKSAGGSKSTFFQLAPDATYQLDLFGKVKNQVRAAEAQIAIGEEAKNSLVLSLVSEVSSDYFQLLELDAALDIAKDTVKTQEASVALVKTRLDYGATNKVELLQAEQVLDSARAQIPELEREIAQTENAINLLAGKMPGSIDRGKLLADQYLPASAPVGVPSSLLQRRPDIRSAEQQLIAADANIAVARAAFYPNISLSLSGGVAMGHINGVPDWHSTIWNAAGSLAQPIFNHGRMRSNLKITEAQQREALLGYQKALQNAFTDASNAAIGYQKLHEVRLQQENTVKNLTESAALSKQRYESGLVAYSEVLDAQRQLFSARLGLAQARGNEQIALVTLYKALGGGWRK